VGQIGKARYNAASVAVVKAFNRLAARGLARRVYNHGIYLTGAGMGMAKFILEGKTK
jgi:Mn-dependent DtxR family transcriptional regulator